MKLDPANAKSLIALLGAKWAGRACPMCLVGNWSVGEHIFELREFHGGSLSVGGPVLPVVPVVCTNCGHTVLLNAVIAQVLPPAPTREGGAS